VNTACIDDISRRCLFCLESDILPIVDKNYSAFSLDTVDLSDESRFVIVAVKNDGLLHFHTHIAP